MCRSYSAIGHDAHWLLLSEGGAEHGGCCLSATLRDYGRIGVFALGNGQMPDGRATLPANWMQDSTSPSPAATDRELATHRDAFFTAVAAAF